jgi:hypothetical protein
VTLSLFAVSRNNWKASKAAKQARFSPQNSLYNVIAAPLFPRLRRIAVGMHDPVDREEIIQIVVVPGLES